MRNIAILYADEAWQVVRGCTPISEGCAHCWARRIDKRFNKESDFEPRACAEEINRIEHWRKPRVVAVGFLGDLFHPEISFCHVDRVFNRMLEHGKHEYLILTKRPERLREWMDSYIHADLLPSSHNIYFGISAETQWRLDQRWTCLETLPVRRWLSLEPLLERVDISLWVERVDWVVVGGESGPGWRMMPDPYSIRRIRDTCIEARVPFYFKQYAGYRPKQLPVLDGDIWAQVPWCPNVQRP